MSFRQHENNENYDEYNLPKRRAHGSHLKIPSPNLGNTPTKLVSPSSYLRNPYAPQNFKNSAEKLKDRNSFWCEMPSSMGVEDRYDPGFPLLDRAQATMALNANGELLL
jgi:hypothetical protein